MKRAAVTIVRVNGSGKYKGNVLYDVSIKQNKQTIAMGTG